PAGAAPRPGGARRLAGFLPAGDAGARRTGAGDGGGPAAAGRVLVLADRGAVGARPVVRRGERHRHAREFALLRRAVRAPVGLADRDPCLVDAPGGAGRGAGHGDPPGVLVRPAGAGGGPAAGGARGRVRGDAPAAARSAVALRTRARGPRPRARPARHFVDTATFGSVATPSETVRSSNDRQCVRIARIVTH